VPHVMTFVVFVKDRRFSRTLLAALNLSHRRPMRWRSLPVTLLYLIPMALVSCADPVNPNLPYPPSPNIRTVEFEFGTHVRQASGSDNWPLTWAANGHQYTSWGDGGGFGGNNINGRVSLGVARVEGERTDHTGTNVWGGKDPENPAQFGGKSYGILSLDGVLYMWVSPGSGVTNYEEARLAWSKDHGATWTLSEWAFTDADAIVLPAFLQFGKDYAGARDEYVYTYAIHLMENEDLKVQIPGQIDLMRVPRGSILARSSYEFFAGLRAAGSPSWTEEYARREPVFEDPNGVGWTVSVSHNAGVGRYLLMTEHDESFKGNLGIFDAPEPWGPWTTVDYLDGFAVPGDRASAFYWNFSNKWLSEDGKSFVLVFTGVGENDSWNLVEGTFR